MERLPVFELIDQTVKILNDNRKMLETYADVLHDFFHRVLDDREESLVNISTRVKGESSLREKILRKNLYKRYAYPEGIIQNLSDLIGVYREVCRWAVLRARPAQHPHGFERRATADPEQRLRHLPHRRTLRPHRPERPL